MRHRAGFTLIELSIVLVIVGLIIGGVLVGRDLIRQAELRAVVSQLERYDAAVNTFRIKYDCLPGDCTNPTTFLSGSLHPGDGDGLVNCNVAVGCYVEIFQFWYQLALANLIAGQYTGYPGGSGDTCVVGGANANVPTTRSDSNGGIAITTGYTFGHNNLSGFWFLDNDQVYNIGTTNGGMIALPLYTPNDAWQLDQKMDDGLPGTGRIHAHPYTLTNCTTTTTPGNALYETTYNGQSCAIVVRTQF